MARRVLGENDELTLKMRKNYAEALCNDDGATLDDLREAVATLEETARLSKRTLGNLHPVTGAIEDDLRKAREALAEAGEIKARGFCWDEEGGRRAWTKRENVTS